MGAYTCSIERIVDGDTVDAFVNFGGGPLKLGFPIWLHKRIRIAGIDTPEVRTRDKREKKFGKLAKARVESLLKPGRRCKLITHLGRDKYGRVVGDIIIPRTATAISEILVKERLAVKYDGKQSKSEIKKLHRRNWDAIERREAAHG